MPHLLTTRETAFLTYENVFFGKKNCSLCAAFRLDIGGIGTKPSLAPISLRLNIRRDLFGNIF